MTNGAEKSTAAFRLKVLHLFLRERMGEGTARAFAQALGGERVFADETQPVSYALWVRGIENFSQWAGETALAELDTLFVRPEVAGAWARLLSGVTSPGEILRAVCERDRLPGDSAFVEAQRDGQDWIIVPDSIPNVPERTRRHLLRALESELRALPLLLGVRALTTRIDAAGAPRFRVHIVPPAPSRLKGWTGALAFGTLTIPMMRTVPSVMALGVGAGAIAAVAITIAIGLAFEAIRSERLRRVHSSAQQLRIESLEREATLRSERGRAFAQPDEEPIIAGKYQIGQPLGSGATGSVWSAIRLHDGEEVALKLVRAAVAHDVRATDRLRREAEALELVWHPHVVEVFEAGLLPSGTAYLAMARLHGESLADRLAREGPLDPMEVRTLGLQLADALIAVHSAGVIHRDIKPTNLFLHRTADSQIILKLIDFGVAHIAWAETRITRSGMRIGTLGYAAPEQENGEEASAQADLFSVGITLHECLTGTQRSPGDPPPSASGEAIAEPFREIIQRLTKEDPTERFTGARELREALLALASPSDDAISLPIVLPGRADAAPYPDLDSGPAVTARVGNSKSV